MKRLILSLSLLCGGAGQSFAQAAAPQAGDAFSSFIPLIVIFGIFYFLVIRPQQKQAKEHDAKLKALKRDDKIITTGGMYGTIVSIKDNVLEVKIANNVTVQIARHAVSDVVRDDANKSAADTSAAVISK